MTTYWNLFGQTLASETAWFGLSDSARERDLWQLDHVSIAPEMALDDVVTIDGQEEVPFLEIGRNQNTYRLRFYDDTVADVVPAQRSLTLSSPNTQLAVRHHIANQILPRCLTHRGQLSIHASVVGTPDGAVAFVGPSGAGKSTAAYVCQLAGFPVVADDCLVLRHDTPNFYAQPGVGHVRLRRDRDAWLKASELQMGHDAQNYDKQWLQVNHVTTPQRLKTIFLLEDRLAAGEQDAKTVTVSGQVAFLAIVDATLRLDPHDAIANATEFQLTSTLVNTVPIRHLRLPDNLSALPAIMNQLIGQPHHDQVAA